MIEEGNAPLYHEDITLQEVEFRGPVSKLSLQFPLSRLLQTSTAAVFGTAHTQGPFFPLGVKSFQGKRLGTASGFKRRTVIPKT